MTIRLVHRDAVYLLPEIAELLSLPMSGIRREVREGRLRVSRRGNRRYCLGSWLLAWIEAGEVCRNRRQQSNPPQARAA